VRPEAVLDLSDEPVLGYRERMELAAVALDRGVPYLGSDFRLNPPMWAAPLPVPTVAVIGTGKRTGKTAIAGEAARVAREAGLNPMIVAMGRGGPPEPQVAEAGSVTVESLIERVRRGEHAASDYLEDALFTGVTTVGARRVGGGLAGMPFATNVREAGMIAVELGAGLVILEGSGSSIPPMPWDAGILVAPAGVPLEYLTGYLGPYRILRSDLFVITMSGGSNEPKHLFPLRSHIQRLRADARYVVTDFQPAPLGEVRGKGVYLTTTAPPEAASRQIEHLEGAYGCRVVGFSTRLADRAGLIDRGSRGVRHPRDRVEGGGGGRGLRARHGARRVDRVRRQPPGHDGWRRRRGRPPPRDVRAGGGTPPPGMTVRSEHSREPHRTTT
jgi:cyclic 2,3-diphosphoglycerate synthetase